jgi:hypothetical protein
MTDLIQTASEYKHLHDERQIDEKTGLPYEGFLIDDDENIFHFSDGLLHDSPDGLPAVQRADGHSERYQEGLLSSDIGPAVIALGVSEWWHSGVQIKVVTYGS